MLKLKNISVKNFMSVGNNVQGVRFDDKNLTLVLGNNLDLGGDGSRNGTGKTTIINALSYALYGEALTNIRRDNLINKTNSKQHGDHQSCDYQPRRRGGNPSRCDANHPC